MTPTNTVVLITGVNRGIGNALFASYLARPHHTVIGAVRDPDSSHSTALTTTIPAGPGSKALIIKIDSASHTDAADAIAALQRDEGITKLDVVIANAGIQTALPWVRDVRPEDLMQHFAVNTVGPVVLFQAVLPLMQSAAAGAGVGGAVGSAPKFVTVGSGGGSIGLIGDLPFPNAAYGPGKAALHYLTRKIHVEQPDLVAFPIDPGWTKSDMGNSAAKRFGRGEAEIELEESVRGILNVIDHATRERTSGRLMVWNGSELPW